MYKISYKGSLINSITFGLDCYTSFSNDHKKIALEMFFAVIEQVSKYCIHEQQEVMYKRYFYGGNEITETGIDLFFMAVDKKVNGVETELIFGDFKLKFNH